MMSRVYIVVIVAAFITQALSAPSITTTKDEAKKQLDELEDYTQDQIEIGKDQLNNLTDKTGNELNTASVAQLKQIRSVVKKLSNQLSKVKSDAQSQGKDISECLESSEEFFNQITNKTTYELVIATTLFNEALQATVYIGTALNELVDTYDYWTEIKGELAQCETRNEEKCFDNVVAHINEVKVKIPQDIKNYVKIAEDKVNPTIPEAVKQIEDYSQQLQSQAKATIDDIVDCVNNI